MENFKLGEEVKLKIYDYDDQGNEYVRNVIGVVYQITKSFITIDNGKYKESFKYCEFKKCEPGNIEGEPYDLSLDSYSSDVIGQCIKMFNTGKEGYVFTPQQLNEVKTIIMAEACHYLTREADNIYYIKKVS